jgi:hypothetical protein
LSTHPLLVPRSWKSRAIPLLTLWAFVACYRVKFTFTFTFTLGTAVAQWLRYCATNQMVAGSIPDGVMEFFIDINLIALWPWGRLSL